MKMIEFKQIEKVYQTQAGPVPALRGVNLSVKKGEIVGVIGQSGAGKSTLIRMANLLERPDAGEVWVKGVNLSTLSPAQLRKMRHEIGMIFQHFNLLSSRTVYENIALPLNLLNYPKDKIKAVIEPLLKLSGLEDKTEAYPRELSGGQKQRVAIARALASQPSVLLCDEATSALDHHTTLSILELLKDINQKLGITILLITHEMDVVKSVCDRVALLSSGEIIEYVTTQDFFSKPKSEKARKLIESLSHRALPDYIRLALKPGMEKGLQAVWRLYFMGHNAEIPLVSRAIREHQVEINIFQANIETLKEAMVGIMDLTIKGEGENLENVKAFFLEHGVRVEVLGYV